MQTITGRIANIEIKNIGDHAKAIVDVKGEGRERAFIEFRGRRSVAMLSDYETDSLVQVKFHIEGSDYKKIRFNNLVAFSIEKIEKP